MRALKQLPYGKCRGSLWDGIMHDALASTGSIGAGARACSRRRADVDVCPLKVIGQALLRAVGGAIHLWVTRLHRRIVNPGGIGSRQQYGVHPAVWVDYEQHCQAAHCKPSRSSRPLGCALIAGAWKRRPVGWHPSSKRRPMDAFGAWMNLAAAKARRLPLGVPSRGPRQRHRSLRSQALARGRAKRRCSFATQRVSRCQTSRYRCDEAHARRRV